MSLSTHVLDTSTGRPAVGVAVRLESQGPDGLWTAAGSGVTDADGRLRDWLPAGVPGVGRHRLVFATGAYFGGVACFFPEVSVDFEITAPDGHHHVPLLLSPFGYSTYKGS